MKINTLILLTYTCLSSAAPSVGSGSQEIDGVTFRTFAAEPSSVRLHWTDPRDGENFSHFSDVQKYLNTEGFVVTFLTNAGIYGTNYKPAGLHIESGKELHALNTKKGLGNFHIQPNGVFFITKDGHADVMTTSSYKKKYKDIKSIRLATQSGPMLLVDGKINQQFLKNGKSTHYRSGVCRVNGHVLFFKNDSEPVNFYHFAQAAKFLGCRNALYLDGKISKFYEPEKDMIWHLTRFVGVLSVTKPDTRVQKK